MYELLIGTRDWQNTDWAASFYPENLPEDWQFCFYSNQFRSLLVPAYTWASVTKKDISSWIEDSDTEFKIVCELPEKFSASESIPEIKQSLLEFRNQISQLDGQVVSYLWQPSPEQIVRPDFLSEATALISSAKPLSLLLPVSASSQAVEKHVDASISWSVADSETPQPEGRFLVALCRENDPKRIRYAVEQLRDWMGDERQAALIFEGKDALVSARQARMIAEMLAV